MAFRVSDTRLCAGVARDVCETQRQCTTQAARAMQHHQAMSTGEPSWAPPRPIPRGLADTRMVEIAMQHDPCFTREKTWLHSGTSRTGILVHRPSFADRVHGLFALLGTAYKIQRRAFDRSQATYEAAAASVGIDCAPSDIMLFEFNMPWKELRHEICAMLNEHQGASSAAARSAPGSYEHQLASCALQRTAPETITLALSGMSIFDTSKWGADACPYDEQEYEAALLEMARRPILVVQASGEVSPALPYAMSPSPTTCGNCASPAATIVSSNSSFVPMQCPSVAHSRPGSPLPAMSASSTNVSFGCRSAPGIPATAEGCVTSQTSAQSPDPVNRRLHVDPVALDDLEGAHSVAPPSGRCISPPPRPMTIASCLDPVDTAERQQASVSYRTQILQQALRRRDAVRHLLQH